MGRKSEASGTPGRPSGNVLDVATPVACFAWILVLSFSFAPFDFTFSGARLPETSESGRHLAIFLHLIAFAAFGVADRFAFSRRDSGPPVLVPVLMRGLLLCLIVEAGQIFLPDRHPRVIDFAVNAGGLLLGHVSVPLIRRFGSQSRLMKVTHPVPALVWVRWGLPIVWGAFWCAVLILSTRVVTLQEWDSTYRLFIGNEKSGDRPWVGDLRYVAIYDRALDPAEVEQKFRRRSGPLDNTITRLDESLLVAYDFTGAERFTVKPNGRIATRDLRIDLPPGSEWTAGPSQSLVLDGCLLTSSAPASELSLSIEERDAFSVEVWLRPANLHQRGPARIAGISDGISRRNFTLGQEEDALYFRVRNRFNGPNGSNFELRVPRVFTGEPAQIVATYSQGRSSVFRNGEPFGQPIDLREPSMILRVGTKKPVSDAVTALLAAISLIVMVAVSGLWRGQSSISLLLRMLALGYLLLSAALGTGVLLGSIPRLSLYAWFAPALICWWIVLRFASRHSEERPLTSD